MTWIYPGIQATALDACMTSIARNDFTQPGDYRDFSSGDTPSYLSSRIL